VPALLGQLAVGCHHLPHALRGPSGLLLRPLIDVGAVPFLNCVPAAACGWGASSCQDSRNLQNRSVKTRQGGHGHQPLVRRHSTLTQTTATTLHVGGWSGGRASNDSGGARIILPYAWHREGVVGALLTDNWLSRIPSQVLLGVRSERFYGELAWLMQKLPILAPHSEWAFHARRGGWCIHGAGHVYRGTLDTLECACPRCSRILMGLPALTHLFHKGRSEVLRQLHGGLWCWHR
jgi:hypothetical protein